VSAGTIAPHSETGARFSTVKVNQMMKFRSIALVTMTAASLLACSKKEKAPEGEATTVQPAAAKADAGAAKISSVARAHLPEGCEMVATVDWVRFRELKSVKGNLETEIAKLEKPKTGIPTEDVKDIIEFLEKTNIDLRTDPSELAVCVNGMDKAKGDQPPSFVAIVGGKFRPGAAMDVLDSVTERLKGLVRRAAASGAQKSEPEVIDVAGHKTVHDKVENIFFTQAKDGAFVIGNDRAQFEKALATGKAHEGYKLSGDVIVVALTKSAAPLVAQSLASSPFAAAGKSFAGAHIGVTEQRVTVEAQIDDEKQVAELKTTLEALLKQMSAAPGNPFAPALAGAKVTGEGKLLKLEVQVPDEALNGLVRQVGGAAAPRGQAVPAGAVPVPPAGPAGIVKPPAK
jgi:hypothetical protein